MAEITSIGGVEIFSGITHSQIEKLIVKVLILNYHLFEPTSC
jgi:hypothetical protein